MFANNFLAPIQVRLSPNLVSHTLATADKVIKLGKVKVKGQGRWGRYMRSAERLFSFYFFVLCFFVKKLTAHIVKRNGKIDRVSLLTALSRQPDVVMLY